VRFLLDTCILSELTKTSPNKNTISWIDGHNSDNLYISVITVGELQRGIKKLPQSKKKKDLSTWFDAIIEHYKDRIVPFDLECSLAWGEMISECEKKGSPLSAVDSIIAAQALHYGFVLVTFNVKDFAAAGINLINTLENC
jgi:predicted nucleic acid-binding protein